MDTVEDGRRLVTYQGKDQWRGTGLLFSPLSWALLKRVASGKGTWFLLKLLTGDLQIWIGTFHFTPGLTVQKHEQEVQLFLQGRPRDGKPILLQGDANAQLGWTTLPTGTEPLGIEGKTIMMLDKFSAYGITLTAPLLHSSPRLQAGRGEATVKDTRSTLQQPRVYSGLGPTSMRGPTGFAGRIMS